MPELLDRVSNFFTNGSDARLEARARAKRHVAAMELQFQRIHMIAGEKDELDRRAEVAAERHQATTSTIQGELAIVEDEVTGLMADRKPVPPALEAKRVELIRQRDDANLVLETELAGIRAAKNKLDRERDGLGRLSGELTVARNNLAQAGLGNPELLFEKLLLESKKPFLEAWFNRCQDRIASVENDLETQKRSRQQLAYSMTGREPSFTISAETLAHIEQLKKLAAAAGSEYRACCDRINELYELLVAE